jgi:glycosidase
MEPLAARLRQHLDVVYPSDVAARTTERLVELVAGAPRPRHPVHPPDERDVVLITYPDQVRDPAGTATPLRCLRGLVDRRLDDVVTAVHLLPLHPSTSDDGFAVADYDAVDPAVGTWEDVAAFRPGLGLMLDAVVNHVSASHPWVRGWRRGDPRLAGFVRTADPAVDLSAVVRPRALPLLTPMETTRGVEDVWTTFSADQVDLDYREPDVLVAVTAVLLDYVARGATMLRLDAVAFLWKEEGTDCIHRPETHEIVKLWRTIIDEVEHGVRIVTETNVPHAENMAYLGRGDDQAHLVYQFPLAPLVLAAFTSGDATALTEWARSLPDMAPGTAVLNVLGSHDGIGLRPVQGLLPPAEIARLVDRVRAHGGAVSFRALADGGVAPYELNCVYFDALNPPDEVPHTAVARFLAAHSVPLVMAGVPALYVHALLGSRNWHEGPATTGAPRSINRQKLVVDQLERELAASDGLRRVVLDGIRARVAARRGEPAFHPEAPQRILAVHPQVFAVERTARDGTSRVLAVHNTGATPVTASLDGAPPDAAAEDLLGETGARTDGAGACRVTLDGYEVRWLRFSAA